MTEKQKWENFAKVIKRAMVACENSGHSIPDDFPEVRKIVEAGVTTKPKKDYELSVRKPQPLCIIQNVGKEVRTAIEKIGVTMPENLPTPEKSIQQIEKEQKARLRNKAKNGKLMLDE